MGSMAGQQAQMISSQAQQGGQQQATLVSDEKKDDEEAQPRRSRCERAPVDAGEPAANRGGRAPYFSPRVIQHSRPLTGQSHSKPKP